MHIYLSHCCVYLSDILVSLICLIKIDIRYVTIPISLRNKIICNVPGFWGPLKIFEANPSRMTQKHTLTRGSSKIFSKLLHYYINILDDRLF